MVEACAYSVNPSINPSVNFQSGLSSDVTAKTTMGVTVEKCHRIMSGNDCWNRVCLLMPSVSSWHW